MSHILIVFLGHAWGRKGDFWGIWGQKKAYENRLSSYDFKIETFLTH